MFLTVQIVAVCLAAVAMSLSLAHALEDVDAVYRTALDAGGRSIREPSDQFHGDRSAGIEDRWGNTWWLATQVEDIDEKELKRREAEFRKPS